MSEANLLKVNPKQVHGGTMPLGNVPLRLPHEHLGGGKNKGKKKHRTGEFSFLPLFTSAANSLFFPFLHLYFN